MSKFLFLAFAVILFHSSCQVVGGKRVRGNGNIISETRKIRDFKDLDVSGNFEVELSQDSVPSLVIETDDNLRPFIDIHQEGDLLVIGTRNGYSLKPSHRLVIHLSGNSFRAISASGASNIVGKTKIGNGQALSFDLSGACELNMPVMAEKLDLQATGACEISLKGETKDVKIDASGATDIRCFELMAENVDISLSGAGEAEVFASVSLKASTSGAGDIRYKGDATVEKSISGAGSIKKE